MLNVFKRRDQVTVNSHQNKMLRNERSHLHLADCDSLKVWADAFNRIADVTHLKKFSAEQEVYSYICDMPVARSLASGKLSISVWLKMVNERRCN